MVKEALEEKYSPAQAKLILKRNVKFVRQYSKKDITKALVQRAISNKTYGFIQSHYLAAVPSQRTFARWLQDFEVTQ